MRASSSGLTGGARSGRPGHFTGPARAARPTKRSAHNLCERPGCKHFRSDHRASQACRVAGCDCQAMLFGGTTEPIRKPAPKTRRWTADELARATAMLEDGATYAEVARTLQRAVPSVTQKLPGYGGNAAERRESIRDYRASKPLHNHNRRFLP